MKDIALPQDIQALEAIPGKKWTERDRERLRAWWMEQNQMRIVWLSAARYLGTGATPADVEEAVVEFYLMMDNALRTYEPGQATLSSYLLGICFKRYCASEGGRIRRRLRRQAPPMERQDSEGVEYQLELAEDVYTNDPVRHAEMRAFLTDVGRALQNPMIPEMQRTAFMLCYFEQMSYEEIARTLHVPIGTAKGWVHRTRTKMQSLLAGRGWMECSRGK